MVKLKLYDLVNPRATIDVSVLAHTLVRPAGIKVIKEDYCLVISSHLNFFKSYLFIGKISEWTRV